MSQESSDDPNTPTPTTDDSSPLLQALENGQFDTLFDLLPPTVDPPQRHDLLPPTVDPPQRHNLLPPTVDPPLRIGPDQFTPLHYACQHGRLDVVEKLVTDYNYDLHQLEGVAPTPLQVAAACGCTDIVDYILANGIDSSLKGGVVGPLHLAADNGHLDTLKSLVQSKASRVSVADHDGNTPLHHACAHGHLHVVSYLCDEAKHPLSIGNKKGESPLHIAAKHCHTAIVKYLIDEKQCDPATKDGRVGSTPLHLAAKSGSLEIVKYLANEKTCNIESKTYSKNRKRAVSISSGKTPLHYASFGGHKAVVEYLVNEQICNPRSTDDDGVTPFHLACQEGHMEIVQFFLKLNISEFNKLTTEDGRTLLHCAALSGNIELVKQLAENKNFDLNAMDTEGRTALHYAARNGCTNVVQLLVEELKCNVNGVDQSGITSLHLAAKFGHLETVKYLFSIGHCNGSSTEEHGYTPLHLAAYKGKLEIVRYILNEKLIPVICRDKTGRTPLHIATLAGGLEMVKLLASQPDCDPSCIDKGLKATPLHMASGSGYLDLVRYFVEEKNMNPSCTDKFNSTPVHRAAASGHLDVVRYFVDEKQCNSIAKNKFGNSPLHLACQKGQLAMVKLLLSYSKENMTLRNQVGRVPLDQVTNSEILGEFLQLGVDPSKSSITSRFPYLKHWNQFSPAVKIFILGDSGVGKTTLVKALQGEGFVTEWLSGRFHRIGSGTGESIGINVTTFESRHFGKVVLYDMSGHPGYFAGHSAVLKLACRDSLPIFITMVDLRTTPTEIEHSIRYWSQFIDMSLPKEAPKCVGIVLGNRENDLTKDGSKQKPALLEKATQSLSEVLQYKGWLNIDCRRVASTNMHKLRQLLSQTCDEVRTSFKPSFECRLLRSFMQHKFQSPIIIEYRDLLEYITHSDVPCIKQNETLYRTCQILHSRGYLLFLPDDQSPEAGWIILNQEAVLSMIHGFQKLVELTNKVGLLPVSQLEKTLGAMGFNLILVIQYFLRMEFCLRVVDRRVLYSIFGFDPPIPLEDHLFFPHLITGDIPTDIWLPSEDWGRYFGWAMECLESVCFFTPRFVQMIILRIAALFPFNTDPNSPFPTRKQLTHVWSRGLSWIDSRGIQVLVHLETNCMTATVLTRCKKDATCEMDYYQLRGLVLKEMRLIKDKVCPRAQVQEYVIAPVMAAQYPSPTLPHTVCGVEDIAHTLLTPEADLVKCTHRSIGSDAQESHTPVQYVSLSDIVGFEAYTLLNAALLKDLLTQDNDLCQLSDGDLERIATDFSASELSLISLARILRVALPTSSNLSRTESVVSLLKKWGSKDDSGTVRALRESLSQYSLFAGHPINVMVVPEDVSTHTQSDPTL